MAVAFLEERQLCDLNGYGLEWFLYLEAIIIIDCSVGLMMIR